MCLKKLKSYVAVFADVTVNVKNRVVRVKVHCLLCGYLLSQPALNSYFSLIFQTQDRLISVTAPDVSKRNTFLESPSLPLSL